MINYIIIGVVVLALLGAAWVLRQQKKQGGCSGGCAGCSHACGK